MYQTLLHENGLIDVLKQKHGDNSPPTYEHGNKTIDAIMVSPSLASADRAGWLKFGSGVGDHRIAYLDIDIKKILCKDKNEIVNHDARRLQVGNERCKNKYLEYVEKEFRQHRFAQRLNQL